MLLMDNANRTRWDVCSAWHASGPDFTALSNVTEILVDLNDVIDECHFNINVRATQKPRKGELEVRYLSRTEGKLLFSLICFHTLIDLHR